MLRASALALRARLRLSRSASAAARSLNNKVASHLLFDAASTPPFQGGVDARPTIDSHLEQIAPAGLSCVN
jgi:hypothetical protein